MNKSIGLIIKYYRKINKMSQAQLSKGICVPSYLSKIEHLEVVPTEDLVEALSSRLNLNLVKSLDPAQIKTCDQAIDALVNLDSEKAHQLFEKLEPCLANSDYAMEYLILSYYFLKDPQLKEVLEEALTYYDAANLPNLSLIFYALEKKDGPLLDRHYTKSGFGYYLKGEQIYKKQNYKMALSLFKEAEHHYLMEGRLKGMLYAIKHQGLVYASQGDYPAGATEFSRLDKLLQATGDHVFQDLKSQNHYNLNYIRYILRQPNNLPQLLEERLKTGDFHDSSIHHTLIALYCVTHRDKALGIIEDALKIFTDPESFDHRQINLEKRKLTESHYTRSSSYYEDLTSLIGHLKVHGSPMEYRSRIRELILYLKDQRRYKEALTWTELLNTPRY